MGSSRYLWTLLLSAYCCTAGWAQTKTEAQPLDAVSRLLSSLPADNREEIQHLLTLHPETAKVSAALIQAVSLGNVSLAELLLQKGADANSVDEKSRRTVLMLAAQKGPTAMVELLLKHGADVKAVDPSYQTPLTYAQQGRQWKSAAFLVRAGAKINVHSGMRNRILEDAALQGEVELVNTLLDAGEDPNLGNPLGKAIAKRQFKTAEALIARGASLNADKDDIYGRGPLQIAAITGDLPIIELLLQKGAELNATTEHGDSALALAAKYGHVNVVKFLLERKADPNRSLRTLRAPNEYGVPVNEEDTGQYSRALHLAFSVMRHDVAKLLVKHGARYGTPIFDAILQRDAQQLQTILREHPEALQPVDGPLAGKRQNLPPLDTRLFQPLHIAALMGDSDSVQLLLNAGAQPNSQTTQGWSALHFAAASGDLPTVKLLLDKGADVKVQVKNSVTPLHFAAVRAGEKQAVEIGKLLHQHGADLNAAGSTFSALQYDYGAGRGAYVSFDEGAILAGSVSPLYLAAFFNKVALVEWLLKTGGTLASEDSIGLALHGAARGAATETVKLLLERGANVNVPINGRTPLHEAFAPPVTFAPYMEESFGSDFNSVEGRNERYWTNQLTPIELTPSKRATVELLLMQGADPLAFSKTYNSIDRMTPLDLAMRTNNRELMRKMVEAIKDVHASLERTSGGSMAGSNALQRAAFFGNLYAVELLLARGAQINEEDLAGRTALDEILNPPPYLVNWGQEKILDMAPPNDEKFLAKRQEVATYLVGKGARFGTGALRDTIFTGNLNQLQRLIAKSPSLLNISEGYRVPLLEAADKPEALKILLDKGAPVNSRNSQGYTALYIAAQRNNVQSVKMLLDAGANPDIGDLEERTPLAVVKTNGSRGAEVVALLQARGARDEIGINYRIRANDVEGVKAMIAAQPELALRKTITNGTTPLHLAAETGNLPLVEFFVEKGASLTALNFYRETPLHLAAGAGRSNIVTFLLDKGADLNSDPDVNQPLRYGSRDGVGRVVVATGTPLFKAVAANQQAVVTLLLERGADINHRNVAGETPLLRAKIYKKPEMVTFLTEKGARE